MKTWTCRKPRACKTKEEDGKSRLRQIRQVIESRSSEKCDPNSSHNVHTVTEVLMVTHHLPATLAKTDVVVMARGFRIVQCGLIGDIIVAKGNYLETDTIVVTYFGYLPCYLCLSHL